MIRPAQHVLLGQGRAGEPEPSYPVDNGLVGLWDWNGYDYEIGSSPYPDPYPDLSGNGNDLFTSSGSYTYEDGFIGSGGGAGIVDAAFGGIADVKTRPFTMIMRVPEFYAESNANRYMGFVIDGFDGDPIYTIASDATLRFNGGSLSFTGNGSAAGTYCVRNNGDGTVDVFVDGVEAFSGALPTADAVPDNFRVCRGGWSNPFVFAALHDAALSDEEIAAIHNYAIGA